MKYLIDTDIVIYFLKDLHGVSQIISIHEPEQLNISILTLAELLYGAFKSSQKESNLQRIKKFLKLVNIIPFCEDSTYTYAENKASLRKKGNLIDDMDLMIASTAITNDMTLITNNTKHFSRVPSLKLDNWCVV